MPYYLFCLVCLVCLCAALYCLTRFDRTNKPYTACISTTSMMSKAFDSEIKRLELLSFLIASYKVLTSCDIDRHQQFVCRIDTWDTVLYYDFYDFVNKFDCLHNFNVIRHNNSDYIEIIFSHNA